MPQPRRQDAAAGRSNGRARNQTLGKLLRLCLGPIRFSYELAISNWQLGLGACITAND